eukprot:3150097-Prymnesium_polylepis.1
MDWVVRHQAGRCACGLRAAARMAARTPNAPSHSPTSRARPPSRLSSSLSALVQLLSAIAARTSRPRRAARLGGPATARPAECPLFSAWCPSAGVRVRDSYYDQ